MRTPAPIARSLALAALAGALAAGAPPAAEGSHGCPRAATVFALESTREAIVYKRTRSARLVYGCWRRKGSTYRLNGRGDYGTNHAHERSVVLSGRFTAFEQDWLSGAGGAANSVTVHDLRTGRVVHQASVSEEGGDLGHAATAIVVKRNASVAWISTAESGHEVRLMDTTTPRTGSHPNWRDVPRLLERGEAIDPRSLALVDGRTAVRWTSGGGARTAPID